MLTINDLTSSKDLDTKAMRAVTGGTRRGHEFKFFESIDYDFTEIVNVQHASTKQSNALFQSADIFSNVSGKGNFVQIDGGSNSASQRNVSENINGY